MKVLFLAAFLLASFINGNYPTFLITNSDGLNTELSTQKKCQIYGAIHSEDTKSIILLKPNQDWRFDSVIEIPVVDGKFYYETKLDYPQAVQLFLGEAKENGGGRYMHLFLENEKIELEIFSEDEFEENQVRGGKLNAEYSRFKEKAEKIFGDRKKILSDRLLILEKNKHYYSEEMNDVLDKLKQSESQDEKIIYFKKMGDLKNEKRDKMPEAKMLSERMEAVFNRGESLSAKLY